MNSKHSIHPEVIVKPRDEAPYAGCPELTNAFFTVRLMYADEVRLLDDPRQPQMGVYVFDLLPPLTPQSSTEVSVDVSLDMDFFPGGQQGLPCGQAECNYTSLMSSGMDWIGDKIKDSDMRVPHFNFSASGRADQRVPMN